MSRYAIIARMLRAAGEAANVPYDVLCGHGRQTAAAARCRAAVAYIARTRGFSLSDIAHGLGIDRSSVMGGIKRVEDYCGRHDFRSLMAAVWVVV